MEYNPKKDTYPGTKVDFIIKDNMRKNALRDGDVETYAKLCDELGVDVEVEPLLEMGQAELFLKRRKEIGLDKIVPFP